MSLFPAYSSSNDIKEGSRNHTTETPYNILDETPISIENIIPADKEDELLKSDNSDDEVIVIPPPKRQKLDEDFFEDKLRDRANINVSTLYPPGRPVYDCKAINVDKKKKKKKRVKRYFEVNYKKINEKNYDVDTTEVDGKGSLKDFEKINDKGEKFNDDRYEKVILEKTADYNKRLCDSPNDVNLWIEFVAFQEERLAFDILQEKASSESSAREVCFTRQISVLDKALELNEGNEVLLGRKFELIKHFRPPSEYIASIKEEIKKNESEFLWSELLTAVQTTSSICNEPSVRQMYVAAVKQFSGNQEVAVKLLYRYGVFLRQAGLWEQLMLLLDLTCSMNLEPSEIFNKRVTQQREEQLLEDEDKIMSSGLPTHALWCRIERLRAGVHWHRAAIGASCGADDPQRQADPGLLADIITPISRSKELFTLAVNLLRLMRVPLPAQSTSLLRCLDGHRCTYTDVEYAEALLTPVWGRPHVAQDVTQLLGVVSERPNYFTDQDGYLTFIEELFTVCSNWFEGTEKLVFQLWYISFNVLLLTLNRCQTEAKRIRSSVQKLLKRCRTEPLLYCEFARVEALTTTRERAVHVLNTARSACLSVDKKWFTSVTLAQVDLMLENNSPNEEIATLIMETIGASNVANAIEQMSQQCDTIIERYKNDSSPITPAEHLLPSDDISLFQLYLELLSMSKSPKNAIDEVENLHRINSKFHTDKYMRLSEEVTARVIRRNGFGLWTNDFQLITKYMNKYPRNSTIASKYLDKSVNYKPIPNSLEGFCALLLSELGRESSDRRVLCKLKRVLDGGWGRLRSCPLLWRLRLDFEARCGRIGSAIYKALDECASVKNLYISGCNHSGAHLSELTDLILERGLRLHVMPEELSST